MKFEYVLSGLSYTKLNNYIDRNPVLVEMSKECLSYVNTFAPNHTIGLLYNGMVEKSNAKICKKYIENINSIHSDSGGLQIMQKGKDLTPELENKIYQAQLNGSHIAMSFDHIPVKIIGDGDPRTKMSIKKFIYSEVENSGRISGGFVRRQLEYFDTHDNPLGTKPLIIVQGNSREDFRKYVECILDEIPTKYYSKIGGFAIAGSSIGIGVLEAMDSIYSFADIPVPEEIGNRLHFLGYGSIRRLIPVIVAYKSGVLGKYHISYDSTTHTAKHQFGSVVGTDLRDRDFGMVPYNPDAIAIFGDIYDTFDHIIKKHLKVTRDEWIQYTTKDLYTSNKYHGESLEAQCNIMSCFLAALYSVKNFITVADSLIDKFKIRPDIINLKERGIFEYLLNCKSSKEWFDHYRDKVAPYLESDRIERIHSLDQINTLDCLFE